MDISSAGGSLHEGLNTPTKKPRPVSRRAAAAIRVCVSSRSGADHLRRTARWGRVVMMVMATGTLTDHAGKLETVGRRVKERAGTGGCQGLET